MKENSSFPYSPLVLLLAVSSLERFQTGLAVNMSFFWQMFLSEQASSLLSSVRSFGSASLVEFYPGSDQDSHHLSSQFTLEKLAHKNGKSCLSRYLDLHLVLA